MWEYIYELKRLKWILASDRDMVKYKEEPVWSQCGEAESSFSQLKEI